jgi:hypothetical protein
MIVIGSASIPYIIGSRLKELESNLDNKETVNIQILQSTWLENTNTYATTYLDWYKIVDKWMYIEDLRILIE